MGFFQTGWRWCRKCQGFFYSRNATQGICAGGGRHDGGGSGAYALFVDSDSRGPLIPTGPAFGQPGWRWCRKCEALFFSGNPTRGVCPASPGGHDGSGSGRYVVDYTERGGYTSNGEACQGRWRWCLKCQQLVFGGNADPGACAEGGDHLPSGANYCINIAGPHHDVDVAELLVIAPAAFEAALRPLIDHKNATGMPAFLMTREALTRHYSGRDDPEKIKRGIAFAQGYLYTRFVLLVGDASLIPVRYRYTSIPAGSRNWRDGWFTPADLYYANIYRNHDVFRHDPNSDHHWERTSLYSSGDFTGWDANADNKYNEHHWAADARSFNPDDVDGWPDVAVGRVPAHEPSEVAAYVDKVIRYETGEARPSAPVHTIFLDKHYGEALGLARDLIRNGGTDWSEDLVGLNYGREALPARDVRRGSARDTPVEDAAGRSFWISYIGHGSPDGWGTNEENRPLNSERVSGYSNETNLPIVFASSCATGQFVNCPPDHRYRDVDGRTHWYWAEGGTAERPERVYDLGAGSPGSPPVREWRVEGGVTPMITPELPHAYDFADRRSQTFARGWLFGSNGGGAIAYFGATTTHQAFWSSKLETAVLRQVRHRFNILGEWWLLGQRAYWREHFGSEDAIGAPRIFLSYMTLFGDPSLRLA